MLLGRPRRKDLAVKVRTADDKASTIWLVFRGCLRKDASHFDCITRLGVLVDAYLTNHGRPDSHLSLAEHADDRSHFDLARA
eukprot:GDKH01002839.1.p1 GENE.GDKH01002839.1~~GDKH01002839.1.p1  ORF type:complete len:82 (-),score=2.45 GDKH01002839.1:134-379(-)